MDYMKKCKTCQRYKKLNLFYDHPTTKDGKQSSCKTCAKKRAAARLAGTDGEKMRERDRQRNKTEKRKKWRRDWQRKYRKKYPGKYKARNKTTNGIRDKKLIPQPCEVCQNKKTEAHHVDYRKKTKVRWLCKRHHQAIHR